HIGDSRGYLLRDGRLHRITHDHSWVQSLIDAGRLDEEEAAFHPHRSLLLKVLNGQPLHNPDLKLLDVDLGDRYLFCSDGLSGFTTDHMIGDILHDPSIDDALASLVAAAHRGGAGDNITIVLADVVEQSDELDARPGVSFGAVLTTRIPDVVPTPTTDGPAAAPTRTTSPGESATPGQGAGHDPERLRYAPALARKRHRLARVVLPAIVLLIFGTLAGSLYAYGRTQYFVAENGGTVGIYQGLPGDVMGLSLHTLVESDPTLVADLPTYFRAQVQTGLKVGSLGDARATLAELRIKAEACIAKRAGTPPTSAPPSTPAPTPGASVSGSTTPQSSGSPAPGSSGSATPGSTATSTPAISSTPVSSSTSVPLDEECG
ncbi:MAG TPA: protein phosphatase, partial [Propionibacteriaceae bacterium]|nr:protein phosphatase [Propionibacteriaceae bacterium]